MRILLAGKRDALVCDARDSEKLLSISRAVHGPCPRCACPSPPAHDDVLAWELLKIMGQDYRSISPALSRQARAQE